MLVEVFDDKGALLEKDRTLVIKEKLMQLVQEGKKIRRENKKQRIYGNNLGKYDDGDNEEPNDDDDIDDVTLEYIFTSNLFLYTSVRAPSYEWGFVCFSRFAAVVHRSSDFNKSGVPRWGTEPEKGQRMRDQEQSEKAGGTDTDMLLNVGAAGDSQGVQVQRNSETLVNDGVFLAAKATGLGGFIDDRGEGNKEFTFESSAAGDGVSSQGAFDGLDQNIGAGLYSAAGTRMDGLEGIPTGFVGDGGGLYKVAVGVTSTTNSREGFGVDSDSFSGQIPVGRAMVEVGAVQVKGRWKRWAREAGVRTTGSSGTDSLNGKRGKAVCEKPQHLFIKGLYSSKCLRDTEDMVELVRNYPTEFKEYYIQMQAAKRSQAPLPSQQEPINWDTIVRMRMS
ncbi:hypothetical protein LWI29_015722 [Acer saccharum]|uniref:Uncharacterized protein n=1 Tax=Acer saccharum TaxID=4024 RepID=A0AA39S6X6_ACESA|nr:hypothetical protein LWI29_015722 [Acer saccharum]